MGVSAKHGLRELEQTLSTPAAISQPVPVPQPRPRSPSSPGTESTDSQTPTRLQQFDDDVSEQHVPVHQHDPKKLVTFGAHDADNPYNWSKPKKVFIVVAGIIMVINSTLESSLPSGAIEALRQYFNVQDSVQFPLPISCFVAGYCVGPTIAAPLSEYIGRKPVMLGFFLVATVFTMACALAPSWPLLLFFRFVSGLGASGPIGIVGGMYADLYDDPRQRGTSMAWFMVATTAGPIIAPPISGFISQSASWRWVFWFGFIFAAVTIPIILIMPETYAPVLLRRKARQMRNDTGDHEWVAKSELEKKSFQHILTVVMTRPWRMLFQEVIVMCVCAYCALAYGIFYLYFQAYPIIFQGPNSVYKWSPGVAGLAFLPITLGAVASAPVWMWWDAYVAKARKRNAPWTQQEEYNRLPLACIGGPLYVIALFWIGWSAREGTHWIVPTLSGVPFGMGFLLIFMALLNYLTDAYETFAASAQSIASTCRSLFGVVLPLASASMFHTLGVAWACSLLAFLSLGMVAIPFVFIWYGDSIRANSKFCQQLKELKAKDKAEQAERDRERENSLERDHAQVTDLEKA
ncbi:hypothetical protein PV10_01156 [Exophiala mesophila]|uniref:Major facilitator superfamily (MFS) profile domain-containing protein n=1 Tax=Exophiala mesophila TaxID=212818 RepID=A0A0D1Y9S9_EXOME|nr:uncharacterized protein PV10_01156 [Exophiala mesophila]KIV97401.1 hypothetical protein PV10_01156 [Exophiala mesophila]